MSASDFPVAARRRLSWQSAAMRLMTAQDAADLLGPLVTRGDGEALAIAHLDDERRVLDTVIVRGAHDRVDLPLRAIMAAALRLDAVGMVIAHSHPGGDPSPSDMDIAMTRRLAAAGEAVEVRLHDHLIFAGDAVRSLRGLGLI